MLDNIPHIKAYWIMMTPRIAQIALRFGADDIDGTVVEEKIYHDAGATTSQSLRRGELLRLIRKAGREPVERDTLYQSGDADGIHIYRPGMTKTYLLALLALAVPAGASVKLPAVLSDRMVLQQGSPVRIWGWADPGEAVTVSFLGQKALGDGGCGRQVEGVPEALGGRRPLQDDRRGPEHDRAEGYSGGRGVGRLGAVQHGRDGGARLEPRAGNRQREL